MTKENTDRIVSLDVLRGLVMVIMALDHVRDFIHYGTYFVDPANLATTHPALFFTRWITHFCAPVFVFLAGTSAFLYGVRQQSKKNLSRFLLTRGIWLIFVELAIVNLGISFDIHYSIHFLQVIWAIGISLICLSAFVWLPRQALIVIGLVIIAGHNLLDGLAFPAGSPQAVIWGLLHQQQFFPISADSAVLVIYPVLPWIGLMILGYVFGTLYAPGYDAGKRKALLWKMGLASVALFVALRTFNLYGEPRPWAPQSDPAYSVISFFNVSKYPPSLMYLLMTIGPALLFLYWADNRFRRPQHFFAIFGRVPFFYYIIHFYVVHVMGVLGVVYAGRPWTDMILSAGNFTQPKLPPDYGYNLFVTYAVWLFVIAVMYPLCRWYDGYKRAHRDQWWLSYL